MKNTDTPASEITFGLEFETLIPTSSGISIGSYYGGNPVRTGITPAGDSIAAPTYRGQHMLAATDGSLRPDSPSQRGCEFKTPVLKGEDGVRFLKEMVSFLNAIGAKVNRSCGLHVTLGVDSITGSSAEADRLRFAGKLINFVNNHEWAIYAQTGADRFANNYSHRLPEHAAQVAKSLMKGGEAIRGAIGRGIVNINKLNEGRVEFRAFAGTLNADKVLHHLATALGLARLAQTRQMVPSFKRSLKKHKATNATEALQRMYRTLGWLNATKSRSEALGMFGSLHTEFRSYRKTALRMAEKFQERFATVVQF
jgi:hypothetical protein